MRSAGVIVVGAGLAGLTAARRVGGSADQGTCGYLMAVPAWGALAELGAALSPAVSPLLWAGTDTSPYCSSYMEGAVRSGERAATAALKQALDIGGAT
jgi:monoamine oxidase